MTFCSILFSTNCGSPFVYECCAHKCAHK